MSLATLNPMVLHFIHLGGFCVVKAQTADRQQNDSGHMSFKDMQPQWAEPA